MDDFNNIYKLKRGIKIFYENDKRNKYFVNGIENRIEQIVANLLDNAVSFSEDNMEVLVKVSKSNNNNVIFLTIIFIINLNIFFNLLNIIIIIYNRFNNGLYINFFHLFFAESNFIF